MARLVLPIVLLGCACSSSRSVVEPPGPPPGRADRGTSVARLAGAEPAEAAPSTSLLAGFDPAVAEPLERWLAHVAPGCEAVFDADGTLWSGDIGEAFFAEMARRGRFVAPSVRAVEDPWTAYRRLEAEDAVRAYRWLAESLGGLEEELVQAWSRELAAEWMPRAYPPMRALVAAAERKGCRCWIVTASQRWVVQAAAAGLGIPAERVLGVDVRVEAGVLSGEVTQFPYAEQKVHVIERVIGRRPSLVAGDSYSDRFMLEQATDVRLCIGTAGGSASKLCELAARRGWLVQRF